MEELRQSFRNVALFYATLLHDPTQLLSETFVRTTYIFQPIEYRAGNRLPEARAMAQNVGGNFVTLHKQFANEGSEGGAGARLSGRSSPLRCCKHSERVFA